MKPGKSGLSRLIDATRYSWLGISAAYRHEAAFRQEVWLTALLFAASFPVASDRTEWLLLVGPLFLVLIVELLNSAIENVVDRVGDEPHPLAGRAKDMGSAAVLFCLLLIALTWIPALWSYLHA